tara:strand:- start:111 stop:371 length:261 start_codon:yes stop_codon:yes gene_type:complete
MEITLENGPFNFTFVVTSEDDRSFLVQSDWDYPGLANTFGWIPCECGETDGTIDCEHKTASEMIDDAHTFLLNNTGIKTEDPGFFS